MSKKLKELQAQFEALKEAFEASQEDDQEEDEVTPVVEETVEETVEDTQEEVITPKDDKYEELTNSVNELKKALNINILGKGEPKKEITEKQRKDAISKSKAIFS